MSDKRFRIKYIQPYILTVAFVFLGGCSNNHPTYENFQTPEYQASTLVPVDTYDTKEVKEYTNEGIIEEVIATYESEDGICKILVYPSYYDVTLDYENADPESVGGAYAETIAKSFPDFEAVMEPYIYENIRMAFDGSYDSDAVEARMNTLYNNLPDDYKKEINGFANKLSNGERGFEENGKISYEEAVIIQMIPDALRPTSCSALSLWGEKTVSGEGITLRSLEWQLGSDNQMGRVNAVTHIKNGEKSLTTFGILGLLDVLSAINDDGVFIAILDVGSMKNEPYVCEGKQCYTFDIRYALENYDNATDVGNYVIANSSNYTWCHNLLITDKNNSYCAEDCVKEVADKGDGFSILRDADTPLMEGLTWDSKDSLCIVNSFATQGNQDSFRGSGNNLIRFEKYNKWVDEKDKFSVKDVKDMITSEQVNQYDVATVHNMNVVQLIIVDYETGDIQVAFTGTDGPMDKPDFIYIGNIND